MYASLLLAITDKFDVVICRRGNWIKLRTVMGEAVCASEATHITG